MRICRASPQMFFSPLHRHHKYARENTLLRYGHQKLGILIFIMHTGIWISRFSLSGRGILKSVYTECEVCFFFVFFLYHHRCESRAGSRWRRRTQTGNERSRENEKKTVRKEIVGREESKEASQSVRGGVGDAEVGSGDYRLSGVFYLWSKCTLAFLLSTPHMQLDSSLAKQTQMKWLLNDFLGNPPRQRKPSIWSLLFPSLSSTLLSPLPLFLFTHHLHISHFDFLSFLPAYSSLICLLVFLFWSPLSYFFFLCKSLFLHCLPYLPFPFFPSLPRFPSPLLCHFSSLHLFLPLPLTDLDKNLFVKLLNRDSICIFLHSHSHILSRDN